MSDFNTLVIERIPNANKAAELINRLFEVADPKAIYSAPTPSGDYTIINASELSVGMGAGFGGGGGIGEPAGDSENEVGGVGGGGGGGGSAMARPVASIIIGPNGVRVEPIVDVTKIAIAMFTALGAIGLALGKMRRFEKTGELD